MKFFYIVLAWALCVAPAAHAMECVGTTYYSVQHELCMDCPPGFDADTTDGKTDISQCQMKCPGGYYMAPSDKYVAVEYVHFDNRGASLYDRKNQAFDTNIRLTGDDTLRAVFYPFSSEQMSIAGRYEGQQPSNTSFQIYNIYFRYGGQINTTKLDANKMYDVSVGAGGLIINDEKIHDYDYVDYTQIHTCKIGTIDTHDSQYYGNIYGVYIYRDNELTHRYTPVRRLSDDSIGFYDDITDTFLENIGSERVTGGAESPFYVCTPVGAGFWAAASVTNYGNDGGRNACPAGLTTNGYGPGADEAGDCGPVLHLGDDYKLYLRSDRKTTPSLYVQRGAQIFYGNAIPGNMPRHLHIKHNDTTYSIFDDGESTE